MYEVQDFDMGGFKVTAFRNVQKFHFFSFFYPNNLI